VTLTSFIWMHWVVLKILKRATPHLDHVFEERSHTPASETVPGVPVSG
jgi:hypothetical protein